MWFSLLVLCVVSRFSASSQQDLHTNDLAAGNRLSSGYSPARTEEGTELDTRAKDMATKCWHEDEEFLAKDKIAEWLGKQSVSHLCASVYVVWVVLTI